MVQVGRNVVGSCWRKVGICVVVGVRESIRIKVSKGYLLLNYACKGNNSISCKVRSGMVITGVSCDC